MYFKITKLKKKKRFVTDDMTKMICFYCTSFLSLKHVVVDIIPNIIMICHNDKLRIATGYFGVVCIPAWKTQESCCLTKTHSSSSNDNKHRQNVPEVTLW